MVNLLDLPDELLIQICGGLPPGSSDIKSCRLACQRLCGASSHLLVPVVAVDCRARSLELFNDIIHHPTIGKGVRAIRVGIHSYRHELSEVRASFVKFIVKPTVHDNVILELDNDDDEKNVHDGGAALGFFRRLVLEDSGQLPPGEHAQHDDHVWIRALSLVHDEYQRLYREQESLRRGGTFVNTVASALAKMPHPATLVYHDKPSLRLDMVNIDSLAQEHCDLLDLDINFWLPIWYGILSPMAWSILDHDIFGWGSFGPDPTFEEPQMDFIFDLPCAIAKAGGQARDIQFDLDRDKPLGHLSPGITTKPNFASAMQQLEAFTVISDQSPPEESLVDDYASSVLANAPNLHFLRIVFLFPCVLSKVLVSRPFPHLREIHLNRARIKLPDLVAFLDGLPAHVDSMSLDSIRLREGTWAEALEALREKSYGSFMIEKEMGLAFEPAGSTRASQAKFMKKVRVPGSLSPAEAFVRRITSTNPCRS